MCSFGSLVHPWLTPRVDQQDDGRTPPVCFKTCGRDYGMQVATEIAEGEAKSMERKERMQEEFAKLGLVPVSGQQNPRVSTGLPVLKLLPSRVEPENNFNMHVSAQMAHWLLRSGHPSTTIATYTGYPRPGLFFYRYFC